MFEQPQQLQQQQLQRGALSPVRPASDDDDTADTAAEFDQHLQLKRPFTPIQRKSSRMCQPLAPQKKKRPRKLSPGSTATPSSSFTQESAKIPPPSSCWFTGSQASLPERLRVVVQLPHHSSGNNNNNNNQLPQGGDFVLSQRLITFLDKLNPTVAATGLCPCAWQQSVILRTPLLRRERAADPSVDDLIFMRCMLPEVSTALQAHWRLVIRIYSLCMSMAALSPCRNSLQQRFAKGADPSLVPTAESSLKQRMVGKERSLDAWVTWATSADDGMQQLWRDIATYKLETGRAAKSLEDQRIDELRPLWLMILFELGYNTGVPHAMACQQVADSDCLPDLVVMDPFKIGTYTSSLTKDMFKDQETRAMGPATFLGVIERLSMLARLKMAAMRRNLCQRAPALALLWNAGFRSELLALTREASSTNSVEALKK